MPSRETLSGFKSLGDALSSSLHGLYTENGGTIPLAQRTGKGQTILSFGMPRLCEHAAAMGMNAEGIAYVERRAEAQYERAVAMTESPIERAMVAALITGYWRGCETIPPIVHDAGKDSLESLPQGDVVIVPQMAFVKFRLDFAIVIEKDRRRQIVAIECDGAAFHRDAVKERFRNAYLSSWNIPTFRFKGSEINEDVIKAADEVIASICMWKAS